MKPISSPNSRELSTCMSLNVTSKLSFSVSHIERSLARIMTDFNLLPDFDRSSFDTPLLRSINHATDGLTEYQRACVIIKDLGELTAFQRMEHNIQAMISEYAKASCGRSLSLLILNNLRNWFKMYVETTYPEETSG